MSCIVAIHQPNFFPWMGFFDKIRQSDVFILMDNVQYPKTSRGNWTNRVKILVNGKPKWITGSINRTYKGVKLIRDLRYSSEPDWREKTLKIIENNYFKAPYFEERIPVVTNLISNPDSCVAQYNRVAIESLCELIGIYCKKIIFGSELGVHGSATELLIEMTKAVNGTAYLAGGGASGYQEDAMFEKNKIQLIDQDYKQAEYKQLSPGGFSPGLSVLDYVFNVRA